MDNQEILKRLEAQEKTLGELREQNELLTKVADKKRLQKYMPKEKLGRKIRISLYRESSKDEPRVILGWYSMSSNKAQVTKTGIEEDQRVRLILDGAPNENAGRIGTLKGRLKLTKDPEKIKEIEEELFKLEHGDNEVELSYTDFALKYTEKAEVEVKATEIRDDVTSFVFDYNGKEYKIAATFIN